MSSDESSEEVEVPKTTKGKRKADAKPAKAAKKQKKSKQASSSDESSGVDDPTPVKKGKKTDDSDKPNPDAIALGKTRFATVSEFKGRKRVDIRDYYRANDGKLAPTKKGISLSPEEFAVLKDNIDKIDGLLN